VAEFVRIRNTGEEPFIGKYDGEYITVPAGGEKIVEHDVMVVWMGDPKVENTDRYAERREVFNRLCMMYHAATLTGNDPSLLPPLEAYTEDGERIITVMDDPDGVHLMPSAESDTDIGKLQRQIDRLTQRLNEKVAGLVDAPEDAPEENEARSRPEGEIAAEIAELDGELTGDVITDDDEDFDIPEDTPTKVPVGPAAKKAPAKRAPRKAPPGRPRGTAGTAGKRAASRQK
jgi:hypothetical protein